MVYLDTPDVPVIVPGVIVYAVVDDSLKRCLLGHSIEVFVRREDAERFIEEVRGDNPELATCRLQLARRQMRGGRAGHLPLVRPPSAQCSY